MANKQDKKEFVAACQKLEDEFKEGIDLNRMIGKEERKIYYYFELRCPNGRMSYHFIDHPPGGCVSERDVAAQIILYLLEAVRIEALRIGNIPSPSIGELFLTDKIREESGPEMQDGPAYRKIKMMVQKMAAKHGIKEFCRHIFGWESYLLIPVSSQDEAIEALRAFFQELRETMQIQYGFEVQPFKIDTSDMPKELANRVNSCFTST